MHTGAQNITVLFSPQAGKVIVLLKIQAFHIITRIKTGELIDSNFTSSDISRSGQ